MDTKHTTYRSFLKHLLIDKKKTNPQFSLRSFSKLLGVQPTFLSFVLNGKRDLSENMTQQFIERLKLTNKEAKIFELLVRLEKTTKPTVREKILNDLKEIDPARNTKRNLSIDQFATISDWRHYALFMLIDISEFEWSSITAAKALGIDKFELKKILERLKSLKLIDYQNDERPIKIESRILMDATTPHEAIKKYQTDILHLTENAIVNLNPKERFNGSEMVVLGSDQLAEASEIFEECYRKIFSLARKNSRRKNVYQVGIHLIPMTQLNQKGQKK